MPFQLRLPRPILAAMVAQALAERPNECCGLLAGIIVTEEANVRIGRVVERFPLVNALASPTEYESEPRGMFEAVRAMRRRGLDVLAVYHSHPTSEAVPSKKDLVRNYSPEVVNFIISLTTEPPTVRGWWLSESEYREADWDVEEA
jgi:[CysO sulfur-carrier protein]-S-L-cysteine hydrolase